MFPISAYANRINLKAHSELSNSRSARIMFDILAKKKVPLAKATDAVRRTLDAATNARYASPRLKNLGMIRKQGANLLDELITKFGNFADAISKLPPNSKSTLNRRIAAIAQDGVFDTEVFIELVDCVADCLTQLSPKKHADEALSLLLPAAPSADPRFVAQPRIVVLWEAIPSITRSRIEREIEARLQLRGVALLRSIPAILSSHRPAARIGAPASPNFQFVREVDRIWSSVGLRSGRQYDAIGGAGHVKSAFQRFCNAALAAAGLETQISDRQIANLKRKPVLKNRKARLVH